jgi:hypothetical protein
MGRMSQPRSEVSDSLPPLLSQATGGRRPAGDCVDLREEAGGLEVLRASQDLEAERRRRVVGGPGRGGDED